MAATETFSQYLADSYRQTILGQMMVLSLAERLGVVDTPALRWIPGMQGMPGLTTQHPIVGYLGADRMQDVAEDASVATTQFTKSTFSLTIGRMALARKWSGLNQYTDNIGMFNPAALADDLVASAGVTISWLLANLSDTFGTALGTSGVDLTNTVFLAGIGKLEVANNTGPLTFFGHAEALNNLRSDALTSNAGALQWINARENAALGGAFMGNYVGEYLNVQMIRHTHNVTMNAGADVASALLAPDSVALQFGTPIANAPGQVVIGGGTYQTPQGAQRSVPAIRLEISSENNGLSDNTIMTGVMYVGMSEIQDTRGQTFQSDAP